MNFLILAISAVFFLIALVLNDGSAKYLLAGYNTMSPSEREKVELKGLIAFYKKFFVFLGLSFLLVGFTAIHYFAESIATLIISLYPIVMVIYLLVQCKKFYRTD